MLAHSHSWSRDGVIGIVTRLRAGRSAFWIPVQAKEFFFLQDIQTDPGAHSASCATSTGVLSRALPLPLPSAEVKNKRSYTSLPPIHLHGCSVTILLFWTFWCLNCICHSEMWFKLSAGWEYFREGAHRISENPMCKEKHMKNSEAPFAWRVCVNHP